MRAVADICTAYESTKQRIKQLEAELAEYAQELEQACPGEGEGTTTLATPQGHVVKVVRKYNRNVDQAGAAVLLADHDELDAYFTDTQRYELRVEAYRNAPPHVRQLLDTVVTTKPAKTSINITYTKE